MGERSDENQPPVSSWSSDGSGAEEGPDWSGEVPEVEGYEITAPLGYGGMGTVWGAVQLSTRREVALKLLGRGTFASEKDLARFEREVELTARLQHANIARIYDSGLHRGVYYYAMELIDGVELEEYLRKRALDQGQILDLMRTVCEAVQHAHQRGVIHRDLKPSNILVTEDGQPHIMDFGLAKGFLEKDAGLTVSSDGYAPGTPAYMSPEQAAGHLGQIDIRTDVYSLGVVLFRLLTRESPHNLPGTRYEVLRRIAEEEVKRPREITKDVDRELEALLLRALAHDPKDRYPSAGALAQDIQNYLTGEPLTARPPTTAYFLRKRIRKHRVPLAIAATALAVLISVVGLASKANKLSGDVQRYEKLIEMAIEEFKNEEGSIDKGIAYLQEAIRLEGSRDRRTMPATGSYDNTAKVWDAEIGQELLTLKGDSKPVISVPFSPDGKRVVPVVEFKKQRTVAFSPDGGSWTPLTLGRLIKSAAAALRNGFPTRAMGYLEMAKEEIAKSQVYYERCIGGAVGAAKKGFLWEAIALAEQAKQECMARRDLDRVECSVYLWCVQAAKEQWAVANNKLPGDPVDEAEVDRHIKGGRPKCPAGGNYTYGRIGEAAQCSVPGHTGWTRVVAPAENEE